jgi:hypothetical protein
VPTDGDGVLAGRIGDGALDGVAGGDDVVAADVDGAVAFVAGVLPPAAHPVAMRVATRPVSSVAAFVRVIRSPG